MSKARRPGTERACQQRKRQSEDVSQIVSGIGDERDAASEHSCNDLGQGDRGVEGEAHQEPRRYIALVLGMPLTLVAHAAESPRGTKNVAQA